MHFFTGQLLTVSGAVHQQEIGQRLPRCQLGSSSPLDVAVEKRSQLSLRTTSGRSVVL